MGKHVRNNLSEAQLRTLSETRAALSAIMEGLAATHIAVRRITFERLNSGKPYTEILDLQEGVTALTLTASNLHASVVAILVDDRF